MEYPKLFNAKDLIDGVLRGSRINFKDDEIISEETVASGNNDKLLGPLDKVAEDIKDVIGKLKNFSISSPKSIQPVDSKIQEKEFFEGNKFKKTDRNIFDKFTVTRIPARLQKLSRSSIRIRNDKKNFKIIPRPSSPSTMNSSQILRKGPVAKSKLQDFKRKIILSADTVLESAEKMMMQDHENIIKGTKNMMIKCVNEDKYKCKSPVVNVGGFISSSLKLKSSSDLPVPTKIVTNKISYIESVPKVEQTQNLSKMKKIKNLEEKNGRTKQEPEVIKKKKNLEDKKNSTKQVPEVIRKTEKINTLSNKEKSSPIEDDSADIKDNYLLWRTVQSLKNSCHVKTIETELQGKIKTRNPIMNRKPRASKLIVNKNSTSKKVVPKNKLKANKLNKRFTKPNRGDSLHLSEVNREMKRKIRTRSNSTLQSNNNSTDNKWNMKNYALSVATEPCVVHKSSTTSSKCSSVRRRRSLIENIRTKILAVPRQTLSSLSSKQINEKSYSGRRVSSHSNFLGTGSTTSSITSRPNSSKQLRKEVNKAIKNRKTFTVCGDYPAVRRALQRRGWLEKYDVTNTEKLEQQINRYNNRNFDGPNNILREKNLNDTSKRLMQSKLLANHQVDLYWVANNLEVDFDKIKLTKINKFKSDVFCCTGEQGLSNVIKNARWFEFPGLVNIKHPRTYALSRNEEITDFIEDFRLTAAMSLLKWVIRSHEKKDCEIVSTHGKIPLEAFQFATNECFKMVIEANNQTTDQPMDKADDDEWNQFLEHFYNILHIGHHFEISNLETESSMVEKSTYVIERLTPLYPHIEMDGTLNIWILKPAKGSQQRGIHICRTLQYITKTVENDENVRFVVQKYIERPLLIFNTKFDIRQWFLISSVAPLTIWMYKESYLRFSSQTHNLRKLHESIHATNNSVPKRYQNTSRDITLPNYNMWDSQQFKNYLASIGSSEVYNEVTYKGMKECIIWAVLVHQDRIDKRRNSFELYEADFMLTEDFQPWLIEIHPNPALKPTTPVTSRLCSRVLEDTIKVVVDRTENSKAETGNFEMIYKQSNFPCKNELNMKASKVSGKPVSDHYFSVDEEKKKNDNSQTEKNLFNVKSGIAKKGLTETLESLLKFIQNEKGKRKKSGLITEGTNPTKTSDEEDEAERSSDSSFMNLKSQLDLFSSYRDISMADDERNMIDEALKILKKRNNSEVLRYLVEIIERIVNRSIQNKK